MIEIEVQSSPGLVDTFKGKIVSKGGGDAIEDLRLKV